MGKVIDSMKLNGEVELCLKEAIRQENLEFEWIFGEPENKELNSCSNYFENEIENLKNLKVIITLGKVAFDNCLKIYKKKFMLQKKFEFKHGNKYLLPDNKVLIACYHPSPRNVNTKLISTAMMVNLFVKAKKLANF